MKVTEHAKDRAKKRAGMEQEEAEALWRRGRNASQQDLARLGIAPYEGSFYRVCVRKGQVLVLVSGADGSLITVIKPYEH